MALPHRPLWIALAWCALVVTLGAAYPISQLVPESALRADVVKDYNALAQSTPLEKLSPRDAYSAVFILTESDVTIQPDTVSSLCSKTKQFIQHKRKNIKFEDAYFNQKLSNLLNCPQEKRAYAGNPALIRELKRGVQSDSLNDAYFASLTVLESEGQLPADDFDLVDAALLGSDVVNPDGTGRIAIGSLTSSLGNAGLAYELIGRVAKRRLADGVIDADAELKVKLRQAVEKLKNSFDYLSQFDANPVTNRGLAALVKGASALSQVVEEALPISSEGVFALFSRAMTQQSTVTFENARATLEIVKAATATDSQWAVYAVVASSNFPVGSDELASASDLSYSCVDLRGRSIQGSKVTVTKVAKSHFTTPGTEVSLGPNALKYLDKEPADFYTVLLNADLKGLKSIPSSKAMNRLSFPDSIGSIPRSILRIGEVTSASVNAFVSQKEFGTSGSSDATKATYPKSLTKPLALDVGTDKFLRITIDAFSTKGSLIYPVATLSSKNGGETVAIPFSTGAVAGNFMGKLPIAQEMASLASGEYELKVSLGGIKIKSLIWKVGNVVVTNPSPIAKKAPSDFPESKAHTFPSTESRPFTIISLVFAVICAAPLFVLVKYLLSTRSAAPLLPGEAATRAIFTAQIAFLVLGFNVFYWIKLNIIQAIAVLAVVALPIALGVRNALVSVRQRKGLEIEVVTDRESVSSYVEMEEPRKQEVDSASAESGEIKNEKKRKK